MCGASRIDSQVRRRVGGSSGEGWHENNTGLHSDHRMTPRREFLIVGSAGVCVLAVPFGSFAQQQSKVWRVGFLSPRPRPASLDSDVVFGSFLQGMRELGYIEGKNLVIEWRFADDKVERLPALAAEL